MTAAGDRTEAQLRDHLFVKGNSGETREIRELPEPVRYVVKGLLERLHALEKHIDAYNDPIALHNEITKQIESINAEMKQLTNAQAEAQKTIIKAEKVINQVHVETGKIAKRAEAQTFISSKTLAELRAWEAKKKKAGQEMAKQERAKAKAEAESQPLENLKHEANKKLALLIERHPRVLDSSSSFTPNSIELQPPESLKTLEDRLGPIDSKSLDVLSKVHGRLVKSQARVISLKVEGPDGKVCSQTSHVIGGYSTIRQHQSNTETRAMSKTTKEQVHGSESNKLVDSQHEMDSITAPRVKTRLPSRDRGSTSSTMHTSEAQHTLHVPSGSKK